MELIICAPHINLFCRVVDNKQVLEKKFIIYIQYQLPNSFFFFWQKVNRNAFKKNPNSYRQFFIQNTNYYLQLTSSFPLIY